MTTDKHDDGAMPEDSGHPPHLFYPPRTPRREIDWEKIDLGRMVPRADLENRPSRFFRLIGNFLSRLKRRQSKAQAYTIPIDQAQLLTDGDIEKVLAERLALDAALFPQPQPSAAELAERQVLDAAVRRELEQCSDADLEAIDAPRFMFLRYTDDQGFRARVTQRQRIARELLAERARDGADDHPHDAAIERLDFPADGHAFGGPSTCITHVGEVGFAARDDDGRLARLSNWFFDRLRKMCL